METARTIYIVTAAAAAVAKSLQLCPTLCDPRDGRPPGSSIPGILQARTLEWVAISFSNAWKWKVKVNSLSRVRLLTTPWITAHQVPPSMRFFRQAYWSGVPLPSPDTHVTEEKKNYTAGGQKWCNHYGTQYREASESFKKELPYNPVIPLLNIHQRNSKQDLKEKFAYSSSLKHYSH